MAKQVNWIHSSKYSINLDKCQTYYKSQMTPRAWESLYNSVRQVSALANFSSLQTASAIIYVSRSLILVI